MLQNSLVRGALDEGTLNVKILADSKSQRDDVSVHFKTHTKCFPRPPNPILANHPQDHPPNQPTPPATQATLPSILCGS